MPIPFLLKTDYWMILGL